MPEEMKDSKPEQGTAGKITFGTVSDVLMEALKGLTDPDHMMLALCDLVYAGIWNLQHEIEDGAPGVNWKNPAIALEYAVPWAEDDKAGPDQEGRVLTAEEAQALADRFFKALPDAFDRGIMAGLTDGVAVMTVEGEAGPKPLIVSPPDKAAEYNALPEDERDEYAAGFLGGFTLPCSFKGKDERACPFAGELHFQILPLNVDSERHRAFYMVLVALHFTEGDPSAWSPADKADLWKALYKGLEDLAAPHLKKVGLPPVTLTPAAPEPDRILPARPDYFKTPGRLYDTPRHIEAGSRNLLPFVQDWYKPWTPFNRAVAYAAAALTDTRRREAILAMQEATIRDVEDLVFCLSEEDASTRRSDREDIVQAFGSLLNANLPLVRLNWVQVGTGRNLRWRKRYELITASMFQSAGLVYEDRRTGKRVYADDPSARPARLPAKPSRHKKNPVPQSQVKNVGGLYMLPADKYRLVGFLWRWNTDFAEDFICPQAALDGKNRVRRMLTGGVHHEGKRFVNLSKGIFKVSRNLRAAGHEYAPRLLDFIVSEKTHITARDRKGRAVWIEIEAGKVATLLGLAHMKRDRPQRVTDTITDAVRALKGERVLFQDSDEVPRTDPNPDRRKAPFYRWKVADTWSTVALVPEEQVKEIEAEMDAEAKAGILPPGEPPSSAPKAETAALFPDAVAPKPVIPSGPEVRAAREAAGLTLRAWAKNFKDIGGPSFKTWSMIETGQRATSAGRIVPEVWSRVRDIIAKHKTEGGKEGKTE